MPAAALETALEMPHATPTIQVARERRVRTKSLSVRPLQVLIEPPETLVVGRIPWGTFYLPDPNRAVLDGARRPRPVGGLEVQGAAFAAAARKLEAETLTEYAGRLGYATGLRRLGSLTDALGLEPFGGSLKAINADRERSGLPSGWSGSRVSRRLNDPPVR